MKIFNFIFLFSLLVTRILADNESCSIVTKKYEKCIASFNTVDFDSMCNNYATAMCQELFNNPRKILKDCDKEFVEETSKVFVEMSNTLKYTCARDEYGEYCPLSIIIQRTQREQFTSSSDASKNLSDIFDGLKSSCSSNNCLKISITYLESIKSMASKSNNVSEDDINDINSLLNHLNKCKTMVIRVISHILKSINQKGDDNKVPSYVSGNNTIIENQNDSSSNAFDESNSNQVIIESQDNFSNTTENEIPKNNVNSVPVGDTTTGFISDDIMIYDQNGNAVGSSSGYAQSTSDSQIRFKLSFSIIILTILVNIIF